MVAGNSVGVDFVVCPAVFLLPLWPLVWRLSVLFELVCVERLFWQVLRSLRNLVQNTEGLFEAFGSSPGNLENGVGGL